MAAKSKEGAGGDKKMPVTAIAAGGAGMGERRQPRVPCSTESILRPSLHTTRI